MRGTRAAPRVALITGAANGIGRAVARKLMQEGWRTVLVDLKERELARSFAGKAKTAALIAGDVADPATAARAVAETLERFGRLDGLVSNAGIMIRKPIGQLTLDEWRRVLDTNLTAAFLLARAAEKPLRAARGAIVTIGSTRATMSEANTEAYSASKGGLLALTHALSISFAPDVRVNCVSPGWIKTTDYRALRRKDHAQHPAGRVGRPEDIAEMVAYLLDAERSGFVTGANFVVDGGMTRKMIYVE
jgi:NAD(P)-dependent dehydrogenase (short-subunit alcohol dehydrogenase family)